MPRRRLILNSSSDSDDYSRSRARLEVIVHTDKPVAVPLGTGYKTQSSTKNLENMTQANLDEVVTLDGEIEKQTLLSAKKPALLSTKSRMALQAEKATVALLEKRVKKLERMRKDALDDRKKLEDQLSTLRKEVDEGKNKIDLQKTAMEQAIVDRRKLEEDLLVTQRDSSDNKRKMQEAHKTALDEAKGDFMRLESAYRWLDYSTFLKITRMKESLRKMSEDAEDDNWNLKRSNLEHRLRKQSVEKKMDELEIQCAAIRHELSEEKEKGLCQICFESPKDSMCLPCLHFHYCSICLEKHKERSRSCPTCRTSLSGILKSDIST